MTSTPTSLATFSLDDLRAKNDDDEDSQKLENNQGEYAFDSPSFQTATHGGHNSPLVTSCGATPALKSPRSRLPLSVQRPESEDYYTERLRDLRISNIPIENANNPPRFDQISRFAAFLRL